MKLKKVSALLLAAAMMFTFIITASAAISGTVTIDEIEYNYTIKVYTDGEENDVGGAARIDNNANIVMTPYEGYALLSVNLYNVVNGEESFASGSSYFSSDNPITTETTYPFTPEANTTNIKVSFISLDNTSAVKTGSVVIGTESYSYEFYTYTNGVLSTDGGSISEPATLDETLKTISIPFQENAGYSLERFSVYFDNTLYHTTEVSESGSSIEYSFYDNENIKIEFFFVEQIAVAPEIEELGVYKGKVTIGEGEDAQEVNRFIFFAKATGDFDEAGLLLRYEPEGSYDGTVEYGNEGIGIFKAENFTSTGQFDIDLFGKGIKDYPATYYYRYYAKAGSDVIYNSPSISYFTGPDPVSNVSNVSSAPLLSTSGDVPEETGSDEPENTEIVDNTENTGNDDGAFDAENTVVDEVNEIGGAE